MIAETLPSPNDTIKTKTQEYEVAQRVQVILEDDLDGSSASESVKFSLDGVDYEIDLSTENAAKLRKDFDRWVESARKVTRRRKPSRGGAQATGTPNEIREWARAQGMQISNRGRVPTEAREAYALANS